ncbi:MAG: hypothetical protein HQK83_16455 [Fibrobacteria bacterium]|nr:hypothetical protein [Fibrobacteria bacterium]
MRLTIYFLFISLYTFTSFAQEQDSTTLTPVAIQKVSLNQTPEAKNPATDSLSPTEASRLQTSEKVTSAPTPPPAKQTTIFVPEVETQQLTKKEFIFPQDPKLCAFLSITFPGLGQLYQSNYLKAALFAGTFLVSSGVISYYAKYTKTIEIYDKDHNLHSLSVDYTDYDMSHLNTREKAINISAFTVVGITYVWSIIDAYKSAKKFNREHFFSGNGRKTAKAEVVPYYTGNKAGTELVYRF